MLKVTVDFTKKGIDPKILWYLFTMDTTYVFCTHKTHQRFFTDLSVNAVNGGLRNMSLARHSIVSFLCLFSFNSECGWYSSCSCLHVLPLCTVMYQPLMFQVLVDCPSRKIIDGHYLALDLAHQIKFPGERKVITPGWCVYVFKHSTHRYAGCYNRADLHAAHCRLWVGRVRHAHTDAAVLLHFLTLCTEQEELQVPCSISNGFLRK